MLCFAISLWLSAAASAADGAVELTSTARIGHPIARAGADTNSPSGVAWGPEGEIIYVMDLLNNRIKKFSKDGELQAVWIARQGLGINVDPHTGILWVAMWRNHTVHAYSPEGALLLTLGTEGEVGTEDGQFQAPHDVAIDATRNELWVLDTGNQRVQVFALNEGGELSATHSRTIEVGTAEDKFSRLTQPFGIAVHPAGEFIAIANTGNREIIKMAPDGTILDRWKRPTAAQLRMVGPDKTIGAEPGQFRWPRDVSVDAAGNIYVADTDNERVQVLDSNGDFLRFIVGPNDRERGAFPPRSVAVHPTTGEVLAAASDANRGDHFDADGTHTHSVGWRDRNNDRLNTPAGLALHPSGDIFVSDWMDHRVKRFGPDGSFKAALDLRIEPQHDLQGRIIDPVRYLDPTFGMWPIKASLTFPGSLDIDAEGNLWTLRGSMHYDDDPRLEADWLVRCHTADGEFLRGFGHPDFPRNARMRGISIDRERQHIYIANSMQHKIMKFDFRGELLWSVGSEGAELGQFNFPNGIHVDGARGRIYVVDSRNQRVVALSTEGEILSSWGSAGEGPGEFSFAAFAGVATLADGRVVVTDGGNHRIQFFDMDGTFLGQHGESGFGSVGRWVGIPDVMVHGDQLWLIDQAGGEIEAYSIQPGLVD